MVIKMKLKDYMEYLKILHDRYGDDIEVKVKSETFLGTINGDGDYETDEEYTYASRPRYDKENNCIVIYYGLYFTFWKLKRL